MESPGGAIVVHLSPLRGFEVFSVYHPGLAPGAIHAHPSGVKDKDSLK
jgi:hypothetical protein